MENRQTAGYDSFFWDDTEDLDIVEDASEEPTETMSYPPETVYEVPGKGMVYSLPKGFRVVVRTRGNKYVDVEAPKWRLLKGRWYMRSSAVRALNAYLKDMAPLFKRAGHAPSHRARTAALDTSKGWSRHIHSRYNFEYPVYWWEHCRDRDGQEGDEGILWREHLVAMGYRAAMRDTCRSLPSWALGHKY